MLVYHVHLHIVRRLIRRILYLSRSLSVAIRILDNNVVKETNIACRALMKYGEAINAMVYELLQNCETRVDKWYHHMMLTACNSGEYHICEFLLLYMPYRINDPLTFTQLRPLHVACNKNQPSIRLLLSKDNIDVNAKTSSGSHRCQKCNSTTHEINQICISSGRHHVIHFSLCIMYDFNMLDSLGYSQCQ